MGTSIATPIVEELRERIQRLEGAVARRRTVLSFGVKEIDRRLPEGGLALAHAAVYLSIAPKSNALYLAYGAVKRDVEDTAADPVPLHLRNAPTRLMKELGYGEGYKYAHDFEEKVTDMECLPENLKGKRWYFPTEEGVEKRIRERLAGLKAKK